MFVTVRTGGRSVVDLNGSVKLTELETNPAIISGTGKAIQTSNLAGTFTGAIRRKAHENFWKKGSVGVFRDCPKFLSTTYYLRNG